MSKIDLTPFCSADKSRYSIHKPFVQGGCLCATDGYILVRVPSKEPDTIAGDPGLHLPNVHEKVPWKQRGAWRPWPRRNRVGAPRHCPTCAGKGSYICGKCKYERACPDCGGEGKLYDDVFQSINGRHVGVRCDDLIRTLPKRQYRHVPNPNPEHPILFRFTGGEGLLMPLAKGAVEANP